MCIVCRATAMTDLYKGQRIASAVMEDHHNALNAMKKAAASMLAAAEAFEPGYDKTHKRMVRLIREWAQIEHQREIDAGGDIKHGG